MTLSGSLFCWQLEPENLPIGITALHEDGGLAKTKATPASTAGEHPVQPPLKLVMGMNILHLTEDLHDLAALGLYQAPDGRSYPYLRVKPGLLYVYEPSCGGFQRVGT